MSLMSCLSRLRFRLSAFVGPRMLYGYHRHDGVYLRRTRVSNMTRIEHNPGLHIGDNVYIGHFNFIDASGELTIEEGCQITNYVSVLTHSSHLAIRLYGQHYLDQKEPIGYLRLPTVIGCYSFIGPHSVIMPGTVLGKGSLVRAASYIAAGSYPDFAILAGHPATQIGDTRTVDAPWLSQYPTLHRYYQEWAREQ